MKKIQAKAITVLLIAAIVLAVVPLAAAITVSNIAIQAVTPPSPVGVNVPAGGLLNCSFANVTVPAAQFNMYISTNGLATVGGTDFLWGPLFDNANLTSLTISTYAGGFKVGNNWINGSIPATIPGGRYYAKMWDGNPANTVVTDTYFIVVGGFTVTPTSGGAGRQLTIQGSGFLPNDFVNITYNSIVTPLGTIQNLTATDASGAFNITFPAPDTLTNLAAGAQPFNTLMQLITFNVQQQSDGYLAPSKTYTEYARGLTKVGSATPGAGNVYGNNTDLSATVTAPVNSSVTITGINFYPGTVTLYWDQTTVLGTATANATGYFTTAITVPAAIVGPHNILAKDVNAGINVSIAVIPTFTLIPNTGPVGTPVSVTGYGLPANTKLGLFWFEKDLGDGLYWWLTNATTGPDGQFNVTVTFNAPVAYGGAHAVNAYPAISGTSSAAPGTIIAGATFTITSAIAIAPSNLNNTGSLVTVSMTGLAPNARYAPNIDNQGLFVDQPNTIYPSDLISAPNGTLNVKFVDAGFYPGVHVFSVYLAGTTAPNPYITFNVGVQNDLVVSSLNGSSLMPILTAINDTVATINTSVGTLTVNLNAIGANVTSIKGSVATIQTTLGTMQTSLSTINTQLTSITGTMATLSTSIGTLTTSVNSLSGQISGISTIQSGVATIQSTLGTVTSSLANIDAKLDSLSGTTANLTTSVGSVSTSLDSIGLKVTDIQGGVATIQTDLGTLSGTVTSVSGNVATIQTDLGTIKTNIAAVQADVSSNKSTTESLSPLIIVAIVLALIAAIAAIASIVMMRRKIAG